MVQLLDHEILTREVLDWKGLHLFHFWASSCSQKTRIFLNLKGADWTGHVVDIRNNANTEPWYLGINPRGVVPVLVDDGAVHVESNDIILHLEDRLDGPPLIPADQRDRIAELLRHEDDLHLDLRTVSFRFGRPKGLPGKTPEVLARYRAAGADTVGGAPDTGKAKELAFWDNYGDGSSDAEIRASLAKFRTEFQRLNGLLADSPHLLGDALSVLDIAWFVYANRLKFCGYPLERHPHLAAWFDRLAARPDFAGEVAAKPEVAAAVAERQAAQTAEHKALIDYLKSLDG